MCPEPLGSVLGSSDETWWTNADEPCGQSTLPSDDMQTVVQEVRSHLATLTHYIADCRFDIDALHEFVVGRAESRSTPDCTLIVKAHVEDFRAIIVEELADQFSANDEQSERIQSSVDSMIAWTREELSRLSRKYLDALETLGDMQNEKVDNISSYVVALDLRLTEQLASLHDKCRGMLAETTYFQSATHFPSVKALEEASEEQRASVGLHREDLEHRFDEIHMGRLQNKFSANQATLNQSRAKWDADLSYAQDAFNSSGEQQLSIFSQPQDSKTALSTSTLPNLSV